MIFSWQRFWAIILKEFTQMKRDRFTFGMMIGIPILQLILFGYAINSDPKHLPTAIVTADNSMFTRTLIANMQNSSYFKVIPGNLSDAEASKLLRQNKVQFIVYIPQHFSERLVHGERPQLLVEADATDPAATGIALGTFQNLIQNFSQAFNGNLTYLARADSKY